MSKGKVVMIIDDDDDDRELFAEALKEVSVNIVCLSANGGKEGIDLLRKNSARLPDVIFMDLNMPRMNGKQSLTEIKKIPEFKCIPIVMYSTTRRIEDVEETRRLGASYFLTKPTLFVDICNSLRSLLAIEWEKYIPRDRSI